MMMLKIKIISLTLFLWILAPLLLYAKGGTVVRTYYPSGAMKAEFFKEKGKLNGPSKWYHKDGALGALLTYRDNQLHGLSQTYYESGKVKKQVLMRENKAVGLTRHYRLDGRIEKIEVNDESGKAKVRWMFDENEMMVKCEDLDSVENKP